MAHIKSIGLVILESISVVFSLEGYRISSMFWKLEKDLRFWPIKNTYVMIQFLFLPTGHPSTMYMLGVRLHGRTCICHQAAHDAAHCRGLYMWHLRKNIQGERMAEHAYVIKRHMMRHTAEGCTCDICGKTYKVSYMMLRTANGCAAHTTSVSKHTRWTHGRTRICHEVAHDVALST